MSFTGEAAKEGLRKMLHHSSILRLLFKPSKGYLYAKYKIYSQLSIIRANGALKVQIIKIALLDFELFYTYFLMWVYYIVKFTAL